MDRFEILALVAIVISLLIVSPKSILELAQSVGKVSRELRKSFRDKKTN